MGMYAFRRLRERQAAETAPPQPAPTTEASIAPEPPAPQRRTRKIPQPTPEN